MTSSRRSHPSTLIGTSHRAFMAVWVLIATMRFKAANAHALRVVSEAAPVYDDGR